MNRLTSIDGIITLLFMKIYANFINRIVFIHKYAQNDKTIMTHISNKLLVTFKKF